MTVEKSITDICFDNWWGEIEGFTMRCERCLEDCAASSKESKKAANRSITEWMHTAFSVGMEEGRRIIAEEATRLFSEAVKRGMGAERAASLIGLQAIFQAGYAAGKEEQTP